MDDIVLFNISLDKETHLWDFTSIDPMYEDCNVYQIYGGSQFMVMQDITDEVAKIYNKVAAFKIIDDGPTVDVIMVEELHNNTV